MKAASLHGKRTKTRGKAKTRWPSLSAGLRFPRKQHMNGLGGCQWCLFIRCS